MIEKDILWLVVARSGSKSILDKNVKLLGGIPLLAYRVKSAVQSSYTNDVWISTDSESYAKIANQYGAQVPFIRPPELSTDQASSIDVVLHAVNFAEIQNKKYKFIGLLEPTSPFISTEILDGAVAQLLSNTDASAIVATKESRPNKVFVQKQATFLTELSNNLKEIKKLGRQNFEKEITPAGGFYISRWNDFLEFKTFYNYNTLSYEVDDIAGLEIDEPIDWFFAEFIFEKQIFNKNNLFES
jgi:N-acylneuraminate cytidylyltransferase/CMP-N,N'-diacetyllegionaminic acid synthase